MEAVSPSLREPSRGAVSATHADEAIMYCVRGVCILYEGEVDVSGGFSMFAKEFLRANFESGGESGGALSLTCNQKRVDSTSRTRSSAEV